MKKKQIFRKEINLCIFKQPTSSQIKKETVSIIVTYGGCAGGGGVETLYRRGDVIERGGGGGGRGGGGSRGRGYWLHGAVGYQAAGALWERQMGDDRETVRDPG